MWERHTQITDFKPKKPSHNNYTDVRKIISTKLGSKLDFRTYTTGQKMSIALPHNAFKNSLEEDCPRDQETPCAKKQ